MVPRNFPFTIARLQGVAALAARNPGPLISGCINVVEHFRYNRILLKSTAIMSYWISSDESPNITDIVPVTDMRRRCRTNFSVTHETTIQCELVALLGPLWKIDVISRPNPHSHVCKFIIIYRIMFWIPKKKCYWSASLMVRFPILMLVTMCSL